MPKLHIVKTIVIDANIEKIYTHLSNFNHWLAWSPWLIMEPDAKVTIAGDAKSYAWSGRRVGEGNMQIVSEEKNKRINYDLQFLKPWKSKASVSFVLESKESGKVQVSWYMDSSLPFFLFWMKKAMVAYVGMDYERGLKMLKESVEQGYVNSKLEFKGKSDFPATQYLGLKRSCSTDHIDQAMAEDFAKLEKLVEGNTYLKDSKVFSIYHKWDMLKKHVDYSACVSFERVPNTLPAGFEVGHIPATRIYTLRHIGAYEHLGNAWSTLYNMQQNKELKCQKSIHPFEIYVNNPKEVDKRELVTDIHFALR